MISKVGMLIYAVSLDSIGIVIASLTLVLIMLGFFGSENSKTSKEAIMLCSVL